MKCVSIIPARGGSKGILRKNIRILHGRPLILYTIDQSYQSKLIDKTYVSTEDESIASIAGNNGAIVIKRPLELATDDAKMEEVVIHAINSVKEKPDIIVLLQCTSPLRAVDDIDNTIKTLVEGDYDSVFSVRKNTDFLWKQVGKSVFPVNYDFSNRPRRQDMPPEFIENGSIYVFKTKTFEREKLRICGKRGMYLMPYNRSFEIDTPFDLWLCEQILKRGVKK